MLSIILLPGLACDAMVWRDQLPTLSTRHFVHVSDVHSRFDTVQAMATALLSECHGRHVLVGASMGGMLALEVQRQAPERVVGMALLGTSARPDTAELLRLRSDAIVLFEQGRASEVLRANLMLAFHPNQGRRKEVVETYLAMMERAGASQLIRQNRAVMTRVDSRPLLAAIDCPTLVVCGEADLLTPPEHSREIAHGIRSARLEIVPGSGHMLTLEQPSRVTTLLLDWLSHLH